MSPPMRRVEAGILISRFNGMVIVMAWIMLAAGLVLLLLGISFKYINVRRQTRSEIKGEAVDIYNNRNSASGTDGSSGNTPSGFERTVSSPPATEQDNTDEGQRLREKQEDLARINEDLEELIEEINEREKLLKQKVQGIDLEELGQAGSGGSFQDVLEEESKNIEDENIPAHYRQAIELRQQGVETEKIAERLNMGVRETELIFKMHGSGADDDEI